MSRTSIIALLIFGAVLGYFLSFGPETTQKFKASVYQLLAPFLTGGSGIKKQITSVRTGLKSLDQLEQESVSGERTTTGLTPLLNLNFLSKQADLKPGQKVYTSGVGGVFPSGLLVGVVKSYRVRELGGQAQLTPAVDLSHLEDVFVVTGRR